MTQTDDQPRTEDVIWLTEDQQRTWRAYLLGSARLNELLDAGLRRFGLDLAEYEILVVLSESDEEHVRMSDLARAVHQSKSRLTHTIARLERAGLVRRTSCPTDRRGVWAVLTESGLTLLDEAAKDHVRAVRANFVEVIGPADYAALGRAFAAVASHTAPATP
ncbi:MarR family winged helix-turn-helix transcriptional regulator [Microlunatus speluncae]|uniref:MarR family winged helix-turn-helix transcriptional regulator n=1 Tax=Microlunatus speluncae TaxID=2594267 RepID=UPI00126651DC|nr:MarR family transcriptional regulator [Microlunatus speluncae]